MAGDFEYDSLPGTLQEAHRRAATHFFLPAITVHRAYYHPFLSTPEQSLHGSKSELAPAYYETILRHLGISKPEELGKKVSIKYDENKNLNTNDSDAFYFHVYDSRCDADNTKWPYLGMKRIEFHREYICITWFIQCVIENLDAENIRLKLEKRPQSSDQTPWYEFCNTESLFRDLYTGIRTQILSEIKIEDDLQKFADKYKLDIMDYPKKFAEFYGVVLPRRAFKFDGSKIQYPEFPDPLSNGFSKRDVEKSVTSAALFLDSLWQEGLASNLYGPTARNGVACYMQEGHIMYLSALGPRASAEDFDPVTYLAIYMDDSQRTISADDKPERTLIAYPELGYVTKHSHSEIVSWRVSRFVGRLHDAGVARVAALRNFESMKSFNHQLRRIEAKIQRIDRTDPSPEQLKEIEAELRRIASVSGESVVHRSMRARYYLNQIDRLSKDLGVISIPGHQDYAKFIRRYLIQSIEILASVGDRYEALGQQISIRYSIANSIRSIEFQRTAELAACIVILYYVNEFFTKVFKSNLLGPLLKGYFGADGAQWLGIIPSVGAYIMLGLYLRHIIKVPVSGEGKGQHTKTSEVMSTPLTVLMKCIFLPVLAGEFLWRQRGKIAKLWEGIRGRS